MRRVKPGSVANWAGEWRRMAGPEQLEDPLDQVKGTPEAGARTRGDFPDAVYQRQADFRSALRKFVRFSEEQARVHTITPQQHLLLLAVRGHPDYPLVTIGMIAEALQIRHHSTSLLVDRCVKRRLLDRREDPRDRRRALVSLTVEGQKILDDITRANRQEMHTLQGSLFHEELQQALATFDSPPSSAARSG